MYAQSIDPTLPATSDALRLTVREPALVVSAGAEAVGDAGPDVASVTVAVTTAPAWFTGKRGAGDGHVSTGGVESTRNAALTGVPALPAASMLAAYKVCCPGVPTDAPPPANEQPAGSWANVAGGTARSSAQRVSASTPSGPSPPETATMTGDTYQPSLPLGVEGASVTVVVGGALSMRKVTLTGVPAWPAASIAAA